MEVDFICASNDEAVLNENLLASPGIDGAKDVRVQRGFQSASGAYNEGLRLSRAEIVVMLHQDVFLPAGWLARLRKVVQQLDSVDPEWGVLGAFGVDRRRAGYGRIYSTGLGRIVGGPLAMPARVQTLDEVVLVVTTRRELRFDEGLGGFHLYGADICLESARSRRCCYAADLFCIHNTNGIRVLPKSYWRAWKYMRRKWWRDLPIETPCMPITRWGIPAIQYVLWHRVGTWRTGYRPGRRISDPSTFATLG